jgi:hypothetical protein
MVSVLPMRLRGDALDGVEHVSREELIGTAVAVVRHGERTDLLKPKQRWHGRRVAARTWCGLASTKASRLIRG